MGSDIYTIVAYIFVPKNRRETNKMEKEIRKILRSEPHEFIFDQICSELEDFIHYSEKTSPEKLFDAPVLFEDFHRRCHFNVYGGPCYWIIDSVKWENIPIIIKILEVLKEKNIEVEDHGIGFYLWSSSDDFMQPKKGKGYVKKEDKVLGKDLPQIAIDEGNGFLLIGRGRKVEILGEESIAIFIDSFCPYDGGMYNCMFWLKNVDSKGWRAVAVKDSFKQYEEYPRKFLLDYPQFGKLFGGESDE